MTQVKEDLGIRLMINGSVSYISELHVHHIAYCLIVGSIKGQYQMYILEHSLKVIVYNVRLATTLAYCITLHILLS